MCGLSLHFLAQNIKSCAKPKKISRGQRPPADLGRLVWPVLCILCSSSPPFLLSMELRLFIPFSHPLCIGLELKHLISVPLAVSLRHLMCVLSIFPLSWACEGLRCFGSDFAHLQH